MFLLALVHQNPGGHFLHLICHFPQYLYERFKDAEALAAIPVLHMPIATVSKSHP